MDKTNVITLSGDTLLKKIDCIFQFEYDRLLKFTPHKGDYEILNDCYVKIHNAIERGLKFTAHTSTVIINKLKGYINRTVYSLTVNKSEKLINGKKDRLILIEGYDKNLEEKFTFLGACEDDDYEDQIAFLTEKAFKFVKERYNKLDFELFKIYYLYQDENGKRLTYPKLKNLLDMKYDTVKNIIGNIKKDLRSNLINYINDGN